AKPGAPGDKRSRRLREVRDRRGAFERFAGQRGLKLNPATAFMSGELSEKPSFSSVKKRLPVFASTSAPTMKCPPVTVSLLSRDGPLLSTETNCTPTPPPT